MSHAPTDFGVIAVVPPPPRSLQGSMRTGLTEALLTDKDDDSYDLSWLERLPGDPITAIGHLRRLLKDDPDPIDRHFMYLRTGGPPLPVTRCIPLRAGRVQRTCTPHDAEMDGIREALWAKFGRVPLLDTYRQMAIRHQKVKNWNAAIWWAKRGLNLYGQQAARPEAVEDLEKHVAAYETKLSKQSSMAPQITRDTGRTATQGPTETLTCLRCENSFERTVTRGRKLRTVRSGFSTLHGSQPRHALISLWVARHRCRATRSSERGFPRCLQGQSQVADGVEPRRWLERAAARPTRHDHRRGRAQPPLPLNAIQTGLDLDRRRPPAILGEASWLLLRTRL
jgi:hypothetical protein